jgi:hypothetical protein
MLNIKTLPTDELIRLYQIYRANPNIFAHPAEFPDAFTYVEYHVNIKLELKKRFNLQDKSIIL